jgi:predicted deacylase
MADKRIERIPIEDKHHNYRTHIPVGICEGARPGPTLTVMSGVHATEYVAQDGPARFWEALNPSELSGKIVVVLAADLTSVLAQQMYNNPIDGKNLNRIWPGKPDGTLTEVLAHTLMQQVILKTDALVDCHGGEFDEFMAPYVITRIKGDAALDARTLALANALGVPFIEVVQAEGTWLGTGTSIGETVRSGRSGATIEIGERGFRDERQIANLIASLNNAAKHLGIMRGEPVLWAGKPVRLAQGIIMRAPKPGLFDAHVVVGQWIERGQSFATIRDYDGTPIAQMTAPEAGTVLTVLASRAINDDGFAGKIGVVQ